jgi:hypothetical protein
MTRGISNVARGKAYDFMTLLVYCELLALFNRLFFPCLAIQLKNGPNFWLVQGKEEVIGLTPSNTSHPAEPLQTIFLFIYFLNRTNNLYCSL